MTTDSTIHHFDSFDGTRIAWHEVGNPTDRPVILIHGFFSTAQINWIKYGHAARIAARGRRVIMPDLRGHGESERSHDPAHYPPDVLLRDGLALLRHLGFEHGDYDLGGYSLGARTAVRMLASGERPGRVALAGMGLEGIVHTGNRGGYFKRVLSNLGGFERGTSEWLTEAFLKTSGGDPVALLLVLDTFVDTRVGELANLDMPIGVICGLDDDENGSALELVATLPTAEYIPIPGNHMNAVTRRQLGEALAEFFDDAAWP